jgi:two-component system, chemotaxis family, sensor kinase CheA
LQRIADKILVHEQDIIREFLIESSENLNRLDQEVVQLEQCPDDKSLLASIFRTFHTIKGTCGFLGFGALEEVAHGAEEILSQLRAGKQQLSEPLVQLILESVDAIRKILVAIEQSGGEGSGDYADLAQKLRLAASKTPELMKAPASPAPVRDDGEKTCATAESAIRVDVVLLDKLMNLVGELVLARNQVLQFTVQKDDGGLNATSQRLNLITTELQENVMKTRMQPIGVVWNKLPRLVRDVAHSCGKQVNLEMDGSETELDKTIIEAIKDPLTHLVRNCCDHGIESPEDRARCGKPPHGTVSLKAYHEGGQVNIEIADDGGGIDLARVKQKAIEKSLLQADQAARMSEREALHLIFLPGLSTAQTVTNISGRGVGLDVVKANVERIGGVVDVTSRPGEGTVIKLKIPLTLAIIPGLIVTSGGERFLIPQASLLELIRIDGALGGKIEYVHGTPVYRRRGRLLPIAFLNQVLEMDASSPGEVVNIVVLQAEDHQFGLVVDSIRDTQEIVVKPLGKQLKGLSVYAGATIMGDGRVALILDVLGIGQRAGVLAERSAQSSVGPQESVNTEKALQRLLLFRAGSFARLAVPLSLVARLEEFPHSAVEQAGGSAAVQYRGGILKLVSLASILEPGTQASAEVHDPVQIIVFADGSRALGVMVDEVVDIVEESVTVRQPSQRAGLIGSAIVGKKVADFLDVRAVLGVDWLSQANAERRGANVLVAEPSPFVRCVLRSELEMSGHAVHEAATREEAQHRSAADVLLDGFDDPSIKLDRAAMLASIERMAESVGEPQGVESAS